jgi:ABC-2 type transport system ATP-binding protein
MTDQRRGDGLHAIRTSHLSKRYRTASGTIHAVRALNLAVPEGAAFGLLGPNGAGKTTVIQMVLGLTRPTSGTSAVFGSSMQHAATRSRVGYVPEKFQLPRTATAGEFMHMHATLLGLRGAARTSRVREVLERTGIADREHDRLGGFSQGMQQRAAIAQALLGRPDLLVLDEPTSALDPIGRRDVRELIRELHADGATIMFNSHILSEVEAICDQVAIMRRGEIVRQGAIADLVRGSVDVTARVSNLADGDVQHVLEHAGCIQAYKHGDSWEFTVPGEEFLPGVASALVAAGGGILELSPRREGLEDMFMRLLEEEHPGEQEVAA